MSKRKRVWIAVALVGVLSAAGLLLTMFRTSKLVFTESDIQARLNQHLPKTFKEVTIERVAVRLAENRLALRVDMQGTVMRQSVSAVLSGRGVPRYEAQSGAMYFDADDAKIDQLKIARRSVAGGDDTTPRSRLTEAAGSAVQRLGESAMKAFLAARPVYRFKDDFKGIVLKAALVDVAIQQDTLVATFSLWNLTLAVATFALVLIAVLLVIYWLVRHPVWGLEIVADLADVCQ
jgi:Protein of unknown function (DUF1439)